jgi:hypothetical protein
MSRKSKKSDESTSPSSLSKKPPKSLVIAKKGIRSSWDFAEMMSTIMSDLIEESITPNVSNAVVNAGSKLLKVVELQVKYGASVGRQRKILSLVSNTEKK